MKRNVIWLWIGIVLFVIGAAQNLFYEERSLPVTAVITRIKTVDDSDDGPVSYKHTYYGSYTVKGKTYTDKKLKTEHTDCNIPDLDEGDTVEIRVHPLFPGKKETEGGVLGTVGLVIVIYNAAVLIGAKKKQAKKRRSELHSAGFPFSVLPPSGQQKSGPCRPPNIFSIPQLSPCGQHKSAPREQNLRSSQL